MTGKVLFLCPHNAAKSVIAESLFNAHAIERGLDWRADSAGTEPSAEVSPNVARLLKDRALPEPSHPPQRVTAQQLKEAERVVSLGCQSGDLPDSVDALEFWDNIPLPSANLAASFAAIEKDVDDLIRQLEN